MSRERTQHLNTLTTTQKIMEKTIVALLALGGVAMAADTYEAQTWAFGGYNVPEEGATSYSLTMGAYTATITSAVKGNVLTNGTWNDENLADDKKLTTAGSDAFWTAVEEAGLDQASLLWTPHNWIGGATKGDDLVITLSGLEAGAQYNMAALSGLPFEGAGAWNGFALANEYGSSSITLGEQNIAVKNTVTGIVIEDIVADANGKIIFTVDARGSHTAVINGLGLVQTAPAAPEPTTATLSLLALAGLAARRRRK